MKIVIAVDGSKYALHVANAFIGSTASRILQLSDLPVMLVK